ncbi:MAG: tRNA (N6-threonylcarbamoyladenosine(37)-N6)-methyltransferase TrmO [Lachnospiraceae bacterium]|nr:tRNA (N6-threonylcarbamoyladenosine(37)-N6)-methyltransferase TrmO [Lachnospiraceae bacterium]
MNNLKVIAHIRTEFPEKFGVPRQSGLIPGLTGRIVFEPEYRSRDALKGIEEFTHLWILWEFEGVPTENFNATVRPPRLGGNETKGVFATRSPFRPNPIGLSSVKLERVEETAEGPVPVVSGIDMRDNTPIFDIKPYLAYADSHPEASNGFAEEKRNDELEVVFPKDLLQVFEPERQSNIIEILKQDPRPHYQEDPERIYGVAYAGKNVRFKVCGKTLTVVEINRK